MKDFRHAITTRRVDAFRLHFRLPSGKIGVTPEYADPEILDQVRAECEAAGGVFIKKAQVQRAQQKRHFKKRKTMNRRLATEDASNKR